TRISYLLEKILTKEWAQAGFNVTAEGLFDDIFTIFPEVSTVTLEASVTFVDQRGNESIGPWERVTYTRGNYQSVHWKNVGFSAIPELADEFWACPQYYRDRCPGGV